MHRGSRRKAAVVRIISRDDLIVGCSLLVFVLSLCWDHWPRAESREPRAKTILELFPSELFSNTYLSEGLT